MKPAKNLPWQRHYKSTIAPLCNAIFEQFPKEFDSKDDFFQNVPIVRVFDVNKPPKDLKYNVLTIAVASMNEKLENQSNDGLHLVREISFFPLAPGKPCVNERFFMDRNRTNFKAKGWGNGNWRVWLALEDVDAERKKRKKTCAISSEESTVVSSESEETDEKTNNQEDNRISKKVRLLETSFTALPSPTSTAEATFPMLNQFYPNATNFLPLSPHSAFLPHPNPSLHLPSSTFLQLNSRYGKERNLLSPPQHSLSPNIVYTWFPPTPSQNRMPFLGWTH